MRWFCVAMVVLGNALGQEAPPALPALFRVDAAHSGRSRLVAPRRAPKEVARVTTGGAIFSSAAVAPSMIVFGSHDRSIYAVTPSGKLLWKQRTGDLVWTSPAIAPNGTVYIGSDDDRLLALDGKDGKILWQFTAGPCRPSAGPGPESARCDVDGVALAPDGTVLASADGLYAISPAGVQLWKFSLGPVHCASTPAVGKDGTLYVGCQDGGFYALSSQGKKLWEYRMGGDVDSSAAIAPDGTIYVGSDDHKLYAFKPDGALKFAVTTQGAIRSSPAIGQDGTVYVGSSDNSLYAVRPTGVVAWTYRTADRIFSSPMVDGNGVVLFGSEDDRLYAIDPDGRLVWSVLLGGDIDSSPVLGPDGTLYVGCDDKALHILRGEIPPTTAGNSN